MKLILLKWPSRDFYLLNTNTMTALASRDTNDSAEDLNIGVRK